MTEALFLLDPSRTEITSILRATMHTPGNRWRDRNLHKDILETDRYPEAVFIPDRVDGRLASQGNSELDVHGIFRIHGADHDLTLHLQVQASGGRYTVSAHFTIPYAQWHEESQQLFTQGRR